MTAAATPERRSWLPTYYRVRRPLLSLLVLLAVALLLAWPWIIDFYSFKASFFVGLFASAAVSAVLVISLNLAMGYAGLLSLMHTGLLALGAYGVASAAVTRGWSVWAGVLLAVLLCAALSAVVVLVSLRATYLYFGMITLAANLLVIELAREWESVSGGINGLYGLETPSLDIGPTANTTIYFASLLVLAVAYVFQRNLIRSGTGRAGMAVRESSDTASALGIRPATAKLLVFTLAGALAGVAGAMYALLNGFVNPEVGLLDNGLILFVGLLLGGISTLTGPVLGVAAVYVIEYNIRGYAEYRTLILGIILLLAMMVIPKGIVGTWKESRLGRDITDDPPPEQPSGQVPEAIPAVQAEAGVPALEGIGIVKHFGGVKALDGVDVSVAPAMVHGIIGPNGSGKSTLVSCLTRYHHVDAGEVRIGGQVAPGRPYAVARAGVTRVFQVPHLFERVSLLDNVLTGMRIRERQHWWDAVLRLPRYRREDAAERAEALELLAFAGLAGRADWPAASLSHGQKRLLEVVRAVATHPKVLILDEPATGLTGDEVEALATLVRALRQRGLAVVLIEHNVEFVMRVCDRITVLDGGRVIAEGTPAQVRRSEAVLEAYLGAAEPTDRDLAGESV
jgi:branched-chain amino acid transport system ATP-binding protein/branched-chain amino acid transport system permease protein